MTSLIHCGRTTNSSWWLLVSPLNEKGIVACPAISTCFPLPSLVVLLLGSGGMTGIPWRSACCSDMKLQPAPLSGKHETSVSPTRPSTSGSYVVACLCTLSSSRPTDVLLVGVYSHSADRSDHFQKPSEMNSFSNFSATFMMSLASARGTPHMWLIRSMCRFAHFAIVVRGGWLHWSERSSAR